jgi:hypothetical protein
MRICIIYDCLFPYAVRRRRALVSQPAERLGAEGHSVTYVTLRQWRCGERIDLGERIRAVSVGPRMQLYTVSGRRRIFPPRLGSRFCCRRGRRHGDDPRALSAASLKTRGYGMVVVEAAARGTPSIVAAGEDKRGYGAHRGGSQGVIAERADAGSVADAIVLAHRAGLPMRESTARWFADNAEALSLEHSLKTVLENYPRARA